MKTETALEKKSLRSELRRQYAELSPEYIAESDAGILENIADLPEFLSAKVVFSYFSIGNEPDTHKIIELALKMGKTVALPLCHGKGIMDAVIVSDLSVLRPGALNIPEPPENAEVISPDKIDFAIIPALAYSMDGYRLGQGGGYYDRFLQNGKFFTAGIARSKFLLESVPFERHDVKICCIITEKEIARLC